MRNLKTRIERLEQYHGIEEDDGLWFGPWSQLKIDTIDDWLIMKTIVDEDYRKMKSGEIEYNERVDEALCARIQEAISQSKVSVPGERLAVA